MKLKGKHPRGWLRSGWEQQVRRHIQGKKERRTWKRTQEDELWEDGRR
jgi:hypothetical protein